MNSWEIDVAVLVIFLSEINNSLKHLKLLKWLDHENFYYGRTGQEMMMTCGVS